jgi:hypothetical protein
VLRRLKSNPEALVLTLRGKPIATLAAYKEKSEVALGTMKGSLVIKGDIVNTDFSDDWSE